MRDENHCHIASAFVNVVVLDLDLSFLRLYYFMCSNCDLPVLTNFNIPSNTTVWKIQLSVLKEHINICYMAVVLVSDLKMTNAVAETCNLNLLQVHCETKRV